MNCLYGELLVLERFFANFAVLRAAKIATHVKPKKRRNAPLFEHQN